MRNAVSTDQIQINKPEPTVAGWVNNYSTKYVDMADWLKTVDRQLTAAAEQGAQIFVMPELISEAWLCFAPKDRIFPSSHKWQAEQGAIFIDAMKVAAQKYNMLIVAGSLLWQIEDGLWRNRSYILTPDGTVHVQDKIHLMPDEREIAGLGTDDCIHLIDWNGMKIAVIICLDTQITADFYAMLEKGNPDLVLIPSMTIKHSGYNRIFTCAAARAVELHCPVFVIGGVGSFNYRNEVETNVSGASLFIPCEIVFGMEGKRQGIGPFSELDDPNGLLFVTKNVPVHACRYARENDLCEAWYLPNHLKTVGVAA